MIVPRLVVILGVSMMLIGAGDASLAISAPRSTLQKATSHEAAKPRRATDQKPLQYDPLQQLYQDNVLPFIFYKFEKEADGSLTLCIYDLSAELTNSKPSDPKLNLAAYLAGAKPMRALNVEVKFSVRPGDEEEARKGTVFGLLFKPMRPTGALAQKLPKSLISTEAGANGVLIQDAATLRSTIQQVNRINRE